MRISKTCEVLVNKVKWFPAQNISVLCCQDTNDNNVIVKEFLPDIDIVKKLYNAIYEFEGKLFLIPNNARKLLVYNLYDRRFYFLGNNILDKYSEKRCKYASSVKWENYLYIFGRTVPYIIKVDMHTNELILLDQFNEGVPQKLVDLNPNLGLYFADNYAIWNKRVWIPLVGKQSIVEFDLGLNIINLHKLKFGCCAICHHEEDFFWLYSMKEKCLFRWNCKNIVDDLKTIYNVNLRSNYYEIKVEYEDKKIYCKSELECICLDVNKKCLLYSENINKTNVFFNGIADIELYQKYIECFELKDEIFFESENEIFKSENEIINLLYCLAGNKLIRVDLEINEKIGNEIFHLIKSI